MIIYVYSWGSLLWEKRFPYMVRPRHPCGCRRQYAAIVSSREIAKETLAFIFRGIRILLRIYRYILEDATSVDASRFYLTGEGTNQNATAKHGEGTAGLSFYAVGK